MRQFAQNNLGVKENPETAPSLVFLALLYSLCVRSRIPESGRLAWVATRGAKRLGRNRCLSSVVALADPQNERTSL